MQWTARWISHVYDPKQDLGVFAFRNRLSLEHVPVTLPIRISADNRYKLYVNGEMVAFGPQRGDEQHWFYEEIDLAPYLRPGENTLIALVWNFGWLAPMAQHSVRTAFVVDTTAETLEGVEEPAYPGLSTPGAWEVAKLDAWDFAMMHSTIGDFYIDIGPGEEMRLSLKRLDDADFGKPNVICRAEERGTGGGGTPWMLIPRSIPSMRYSRRSEAATIRRGFKGDDDSWLMPETTSKPFTLPAGSKMLLDYSELLCAYPRLRLSGPAGATLKLSYAESLWNDDGSKGNRNEVAGKEMRGYQDKIVLERDPGLYEPLWWRTYRYLLIETSEAVEVESIDAFETGYPMQVESRFEADDSWVKPIWDVSVRTAERCAGETYFDCPYYEQLQYVGDTRIQALLGYYLGRDRQLQRNAVETLGWSLMPNGLTQSRYPSRQTQVIPPFSLWWIMMTYDQVLYDSHRTFGDDVANMSSDIIHAYQRAMIDDQFWHFTDWVPEWKAGVPPGRGYSMNHWLSETARIAKMYRLTKSIFAVADDIAMHMEEYDDEEEDEIEERDYFDSFRRNLREHIDDEDGLVRMGIDEEWTPSEHGEAMFRLYQKILGMPMSPWPYAALERANAAKCTYYFSYYKHLAMQPDDYLAQLGPWKEMIEQGLSTFAENPEPTRSDCHAWSAHPALGFFQHIAGVTSIAPAWKRARIEPKPGSLRRFDARIAHPAGDLVVGYEDGRLTVDSPVPYDLVWQGKEERKKAGRFSI